MLLWLSQSSPSRLHSHQDLLLYRAIAVNAQLQNLIGEICRHPVGSAERQKALNRFLVMVEKLPGIYRTTHQDYLLAWNRTLEWVCQNLERFEVNPATSVEQSLVTWINGYLKWRVRDLYTPDSKYESLRVYLHSFQEEEILVDPLENLPDPQFSLSLLEARIAEMQENQRQQQGKRVRDYILQDPRHELTNCRLRQKPFCHCQIMAIRLLLQEPPETIAKLSRELGVSNQTLYSHWRLRCLPLLQEIGHRLETES